MKKELSYEQAVARFEALCSRSEHCTNEIRAKMEKLGFSAPDIEKALAHLVKEKYIDNNRYSLAFCKDKLRYCHWGRIKIRQALCLQRLTEEEILYGMDGLDEEEYHSALSRLLERKLRRAKGLDNYSAIGKAVRYAASCGFEADLAFSEPKRLVREED